MGEVELGGGSGWKGGGGGPADWGCAREWVFDMSKRIKEDKRRQRSAVHTDEWQREHPSIHPLHARCSRTSANGVVSDSLKAGRTGWGSGWPEDTNVWGGKWWRLTRISDFYPPPPSLSFPPPPSTHAARASPPWGWSAAEEPVSHSPWTLWHSRWLSRRSPPASGARGPARLWSLSAQGLPRWSSRTASASTAPTSTTAGWCSTSMRPARKSSSWGSSTLASGSPASSPPTWSVRWLNS